MKKQPLATTSGTFEAIKRVSDAGDDFWSARELARVLEYSDFRNFLNVLADARTACTQSGHPETDHFVALTDMVEIGSGALRSVEDWLLSRYACYLVIQNANPSKPLVALGQTYFATQTRKQELEEEARQQGEKTPQGRVQITPEKERKKPVTLTISTAPNGGREHSPGLSAAMPWDLTPKHVMRPNGARESAEGREGVGK